MRQPSVRESLNPEKVAYWYFRLNGFFQIENFVVHPSGRGSQRTDADLLAVRFPHRAERLIDDPDDIMEDDLSGLALSSELIDVVIAEVKTNQPCTLNGAWTSPQLQNVHRVLAAIGCVQHDCIDTAASDIYETGIHVSKDFNLRIRFVVFGRNLSEDLAEQYSEVKQLVVLRFIWKRFHDYRHEKAQFDQWDSAGRKIKRLADGHDEENFVIKALHLMGVDHPVQ